MAGTALNQLSIAGAQSIIDLKIFRAQSVNPLDHTKFVLISGIGAHITNIHAYWRVDFSINSVDFANIISRIEVWIISSQTGSSHSTFHTGAGDGANKH